MTGTVACKCAERIGRWTGVDRSDLVFSEGSAFPVPGEGDGFLASHFGGLSREILIVLETRATSDNRDSELLV